jgi:Recombinase
MVHSILRNENYVGNLVYNRTSRRLGQTQVNNPDHLWIRSPGAVSPVIDRDLFARAQKIMAERYISIPEDQMLRRLRLTLGRKGKLTTRIIKNAPGLPSVACYIKQFGSLRDRLIVATRDDGRRPARPTHMNSTQPGLKLT